MRTCLEGSSAFHLHGTTIPNERTTRVEKKSAPSSRSPTMRCLSRFLNTVAAMRIARGEAPTEPAKIAEECARGSFNLVLGTAASRTIGAIGVIVSPPLARYATSLRSQGRYAKLVSMWARRLSFISPATLNLRFHRIPSIL